MQTSIPSKICKRCNQEKPLADFPGGKRGRGSSICEPCRATSNEVPVEDFAKPSNCRLCNKFIIASGSCYTCATGNERIYTPEWINTRQEAREIERLIQEQSEDL